MNDRGPRCALEVRSDEEWRGILTAQQVSQHSSITHPSTRYTTLFCWIIIRNLHDHPQTSQRCCDIELTDLPLFSFISSENERRNNQEHLPLTLRPIQVPTVSPVYSAPYSLYPSAILHSTHPIALSPYALRHEECPKLIGVKVA